MGYAACLDRGDRSGVTLERGLMLLDRALAPGRDMRPTCRRLDELGEALAERLRLRPPGPRRALAIVELLAGEEGFEGSDEDYRQPDNTSLARALVRRSGLPLTLCALYQAVARRAGVTAHLLPFPGHVLLELRDGSERYLVDAYGGGRLMQPRQCLAHLAVHGIPFRERWLTPATDGEMLARQVHNAVRALVQRGRGGESKGLAWALELLTPAAR
jgi:regulator of sirC expression with transglutaminase-like and TPR domain